MYNYNQENSHTKSIILDTIGYIIGGRILFYTWDLNERKQEIVNKEDVVQQDKLLFENLILNNYNIPDVIDDLTYTYKILNPNILIRSIAMANFKDVDLTIKLVEEIIKNNLVTREAYKQATIDYITVDLDDIGISCQKRLLHISANI